MKRLIISASAIAVASASFAPMAAYAGGVPVIDAANYEVAKQTSVTTDKILGTNKEILTTVEETLKAVTGDRGGDANQMQNLAVGNGFSVSSMPSSTALCPAGCQILAAWAVTSPRSRPLSSTGFSSLRTCRGKQIAALAETSPMNRWSTLCLVSPHS